MFKRQLRPNLAPIVERPIEEIATFDDAELQRLLGRVHASTLPGFVIRSTAGYQHLDDHIVTLYSQISGQNHAISRTLQNVARRLNTSKRGFGALHHDGVTYEGLNLHETLSGSGKVLLANSGRAEPTLSKKKQQLADTLLRRGFVDPLIMSPELHTADLRVGDKIVFAFANDFGPVWHRFDTTIEPRDSRVQVIEPETRINSED